MRGRSENAVELSSFNVVKSTVFGPNRSRSPSELSRLRANGIDDPEDDPTVLIHSPDAAQPRVWFQRVPEPKQVKNRVHLDIAAADLESEADRLVGLGATRQAEQPVPTLIVLADPEGNEFCVIT